MFVTTLAWGTNNVFVMSSRFHMGYTLQKFESFKQMWYKFLNLATSYELLNWDASKLKNGLFEALEVTWDVWVLVEMGMYLSAFNVLGMSKVCLWS